MKTRFFRIFRPISLYFDYLHIVSHANKLFSGSRITNPMCSQVCAAGVTAKNKKKIKLNMYIEKFRNFFLKKKDFSSFFDALRTIDGADHESDVHLKIGLEITWQNSKQNRVCTEKTFF